MMTFCFTGIRSFPKLWKNNPYLGLSPGDSYLSLFLKDCYGIWNQQKWFSLKTVSAQNTKAVNLLTAKARYLRKGDEGSNKQVSSDSHLFAAGAAKKRSEMNPHKEDRALPPVRNTIQLPTKPLNSEEWDKLKEDFKGKAKMDLYP